MNKSFIVDMSAKNSFSNSIIVVKRTSIANNNACLVPSENEGNSKVFIEFKFGILRNKEKTFLYYIV